MPADANKESSQKFSCALTASAALAGEVRNHFRQQALESERHSPACVLIDRTNSFTAHCLSACARLASDSLMLQALVVCRPAFETSVRILWAVTVPLGLERVIIYCIDEDVKWARDAKSIMPGGHPAVVLENRQAARTKLVGAHGEPLPPAPAMWQLLKDLEDVDVEAGRLMPDEDRHLFSYAQVYRVLSGIIHGHPDRIAELPAPAHWPHLALTAGYAVSALSHANHRFMSAQSRPSLPTISKSLQEIKTLLDDAAAVGLKEDEKS